MEIKKVKIPSKKLVGDRLLEKQCTQLRKLGIEDDKYVNFTYHLKDDNDYFNPIYIIKSDGIYIYLKGNYNIVDKLPPGIYNYILFQNDRNEYILTVSLFNPREIGTKHIMIYNRLDADNTDFDYFILSGELNLKYDDDQYHIIFNDESSFYWFTDINFKKYLFIQILKSLIPDLEKVFSSDEKLLTTKDRYWEKYLKERLTEFGITCKETPFRMAAYNYKIFKKKLEKTDSDNYIEKKNAYSMLASLGVFNFEKESIYNSELNKLMKHVFSTLMYFSSNPGTIYFGNVDMEITDEMFFKDLCYKDIALIDSCNVGDGILIREGDMDSPYYNKRGVIDSCDECEEDDYYRINFRDPELDSKCIKKYDIYKMNMSEFLDRFSVFNSEEDCYENRDKVNHLCDYF
jgi:hypothetical protein